MDSDSEKTADRFNLKVGPEVFDWVKDEQHRLRKLTGKQPTQNEVMLKLIELASAEKRQSVERPALTEGSVKAGHVPRSLAPIIDWLIDFFSHPGKPEDEVLKNSLRVLAARRDAELKRSR
jgi:hypothetical protein